MASHDEKILYVLQSIDRTLKRIAVALEGRPDGDSDDR